MEAPESLSIKELINLIKHKIKLATIIVDDKVYLEINYKDYIGGM
jgi:hypothetical protein